MPKHKPKKLVPTKPAKAMMPAAQTMMKSQAMMSSAQPVLKKKPKQGKAMGGGHTGH